MGNAENTLYKKAEKIYTLSEGMKEVLTTYGSAEK